MSFSVEVDGEMKDSRSSKLDMTKLLAAIAGAVSVKDKVQVVTPVPTGSVRRSDLSLKLFFLNRLSKDDITLLVTLIKKTYADMKSSKFVV